ncbi:alpha/beta fold hydrolase [Nocardioides mangrovicus]|uniref:Alpha/beta fold hydrolase n=1 Tax=Nocardioides mangrovicus TaxID=2478913 RepID=A0A3L8P6P8_9ACTN|nr:alpha/beta fold hydrolase [Nocardioides mangrovicus]RLV51090.1 alpha/beta fold hydrolase [Nocardioides mangrovicus]
MPFDSSEGRALSRVEPGRPPRGVVLMLHGGTQHSTEPVTSRSGSLWRMEVLRSAIAHRLTREGYATWLLRYGVRGWNAELDAPSPVADARWALDQVRDAHGEVPVVLLGHSMGGRTAAYVADDRNVTGVVGLAPWLERDDPVGALEARDLVCGHGLRDRITSARATRAYVERARAVARLAEFDPLGAAGHYMLYRPHMWHRFALRQTLRLLAV